MRSSGLISGASLLALALASPVANSLGCPVLVQLIDHVRANAAADTFCSSYLKLAPAATTSTSTQTSTSTVYSGTTSTSVVFMSGDPASTTTPAKSTSVAKRGLNRRLAAIDISAACSCLSLPTAVATHIAVATTVKTVTTTPPVLTSTVNPCANPFPTNIPTMPYGDAINSASFSTANTLYYITSTPEGASAQACCNTCFFGVENCVNAFWYSYEGCVVQQAVNVTGNGVGLSAQCPGGQLKGLTYSNDTAPAFRSTGNIAGPCGVSYANVA